MTRTAIRNTSFALATMSLLIAFTALTAYAQSGSPYKGAAITSAAISGSQPNASKGLAQRAQRNSATHYEIRWWKDHTNGGR